MAIKVEWPADTPAFMAQALSSMAEIRQGQENFARNMREMAVQQEVARMAEIRQQTQVITELGEVIKSTRGSTDSDLANTIAAMVRHHAAPDPQLAGLLGEMGSAIKESAAMQRSWTANAMGQREDLREQFKGVQAAFADNSARQLESAARASSASARSRCPRPCG
jgi:hypothetical protein